MNTFTGGNGGKMDAFAKELVKQASTPEATELRKERAEEFKDFSEGIAAQISENLDRGLSLNKQIEQTKIKLRNLAGEEETKILIKLIENASNKLDEFSIAKACFDSMSIMYEIKIKDENTKNLCYHLIALHTELNKNIEDSF